MKVLIVDDEVLVRVGLMTTIAWEENGFEVVGEAADGERALAIALQQKPDIVLTDMIMPKMSGLELIRALKERLPKTRVIVLSCHNDFDLVREAMQMWGAVDYLFKLSMEPPEILEVLLKVKDKIIKEERDKAAELSYQRMMRRNEILEYSRALHEQMKQNPYISAAMRQGSGKKSLLPTGNYAVLVLRLRGDKEISIDMEEKLCRLALEEQEQFEILGNVFSFSTKEFCAYWQAHDSGELENIVRHFKVRCGDVESDLVGGYEIVHMDNVDFQEAYSRARNYAMIETMPQNSYGRTIQQAMDYLQSHYQENIKLATLANHVHMNESYLSTIFKKSTGYSFTDALNKTRIDAAKKLLATTTISVNLISERVGFSSWSYFSRVFKKTVHMTPAEYRKYNRSSKNQ